MTDYHAMANYFFRSAIEKRNVSNYIFEKHFEIKDISLSNICKNNSIILLYEAVNYTDLETVFTAFLKRGIFNSFPRDILITNKMACIADKINSLEERILSETSI